MSTPNDSLTNLPCGPYDPFPDIDAEMERQGFTPRTMDGGGELRWVEYRRDGESHLCFFCINGIRPSAKDGLVASSRCGKPEYTHTVSISHGEIAPQFDWGTLSEFFRDGNRTSS